MFHIVITCIHNWFNYSTSACHFCGRMDDGVNLNINTIIWKSIFHARPTFTCRTVDFDLNIAYSMWHYVLLRLEHLIFYNIWKSIYWLSCKGPPLPPVPYKLIHWPTFAADDTTMAGYIGSMNSFVVVLLLRHNYLQAFSLPVKTRLLGRKQKQYVGPRYIMITIVFKQRGNVDVVIIVFKQKNT